MNGLELSRAFFEECGRPMLEESFPSLLPYLAAGLCGSGSECFGYDDALSRDHDFEPGFLLFLPGEDVVSRRDEFLLERAYAKLPKSFRGLERAAVNPVGGARHGVMRTAEYFQKKVGAPDGRLDIAQWLAVPEQALAEATNGEMYFDRYGEVTSVRERLRCFPEDVRFKRLAGHLLLMAQSGLYNYPRCLGHGETGAAQLAAGEFVRSAMSAAFLLKRRYQPFYKWAFRALRELDGLGDLADDLEWLLSTGNDAALSREKTARIEYSAATIAAECARQGLVTAPGPELEPLAYQVNARIRDPELRNRHILAAV